MDDVGRKRRRREDGGGGEDFSGLLWVLNEMMILKFSAQDLMQTLKSLKAMITESNRSGYESVTKGRLEE